MKRAVVLVSGGMDSAVTLAIARAEGFECYALSVNYGQRHESELQAADRVCAMLGAAAHKEVRVDLRSFGGSALTADIAVPELPTSGIPVIMLSVALSWAEVLGAQDVFCGVNAVDYSGYPDCRPEYIKAFEIMANLATQAGVEGNTLRIRTPIIALSKADIVREGVRLGVDFSQTVSCYQADATGLACGKCDACRLRAEGFMSAGIPDSTRYVAH
jgi:7-cyano-7-deazaguanine synthase